MRSFVPGWKIAHRRMTQGQTDDLLRQKLLFVQNFGSEDDTRRRDYRMRIVGYVAEQLRVADEIHALLDAAKSAYPNRMIYFESIGFDLF